MGLSNQYIGETEELPAKGDPKPYSRLWIHRFANRHGSAYADCEAQELGGELKKKFGDELVSDEIITELLDGDELDLSGALGRNLEEDEEQYLEENPRSVVIDI